MMETEKQWLCKGGLNVILSCGLPVLWLLWSHACFIWDLSLPYHILNPPSSQYWIVNFTILFHPFKTKPESAPWLNDTTAVRRECRKKLNKWKKDTLQLSFDILKDSWCSNYKIVKVEKLFRITTNFVFLFNTNSTILSTSPSCLEKTVKSSHCDH